MSRAHSHHHHADHGDGGLHAHHATPADAQDARAQFLPFRLPAEARLAKLEGFNQRSEIAWFGFKGGFAGPQLAEIVVSRMQSGILGGGGGPALNGGAIAAGFDAAFVLAGLGHFDSDVVITLELSVQFLALAISERPLVFRAGVTRSSRALAFAQGALLPEGGGQAFATATAVLAPADKRRPA